MISRMPVVILLLVSALPVARTAETDLKTIMQGLRDATVEISDGLLTGDDDKVAAGAARVAAHPRIPPAQLRLVAAELGAEMTAFKQFDTAVHELAVSIGEAAAAGDRARAIDDYQQMLDGCFGCHAAYRERVAAVLAGAPAAE